MDELTEDMQNVNLENRQHEHNNDRRYHTRSSEEQFWWQKETPVKGLPPPLPAKVRKNTEAILAGSQGENVDETEYPILSEKEFEDHPEPVRRTKFTNQEIKWVWSKTTKPLENTEYRVDIYGNVLLYNAYDSKNALGGWCIQYIFPHCRGGQGALGNLYAVCCRTAYGLLELDTIMGGTKNNGSFFTAGVPVGTVRYLHEGRGTYIGFNDPNALLKAGGNWMCDDLDGLFSKNIDAHIQGSDLQKILLKHFIDDVMSGNTLLADKKMRTATVRTIVDAIQDIHRSEPSVMSSFDAIERLLVCDKNLKIQDVRGILDGYRYGKLEAGERVRTDKNNNTSKITDDIPTCDHCGKSLNNILDKIKTCGTCQVPNYCSQRCVQSNWNVIHWKICNLKENEAQRTLFEDDNE